MRFIQSMLGCAGYWHTMAFSLYIRTFKKARPISGIAEYRLLIAPAVQIRLAERYLYMARMDQFCGD
jgi:hypothetical protein